MSGEVRDMSGKVIDLSGEIIELSCDFKDSKVIPFTGISEDEVPLIREREIAVKEDPVNRSGKVVNSATIKKINFIIALVNYIFVVIISAVALRFSLQLAGIADNMYYKISYILVYPVFMFLDTFPVYGIQNIEREALFAIGLYAVLSVLIIRAINIVKDFIEFRYEVDKKAYKDLVKFKRELKKEKMYEKDHFYYN